MDRIDAMTTLIAAVDGGSLSAASRSLRMPLATVSRKVSELEAHLRTQLVVRSSRKLSLTEAGLIYVEASRRILQDIHDAERAAAGEYVAPRGHLTITSTTMFGRLYVQPILIEFLKAYPDVTVRLILVDDAAGLVDKHIDAAIRIGALPDKAMVATGLGHIGRVTCASPAYLAERGEPQRLEDLFRHDCIMFEGQSAGTMWKFVKEKRVVRLPIQPRYAVNSADAAISAAIASAGITRVLSYQIGAALAAGTLRTVLREFESEPLPVHILYGEQSRLPLKLRAFIDFAVPRLRRSIPAFPT